MLAQYGQVVVITLNYRLGIFGEFARLEFGFEFGFEFDVVRVRCACVSGSKVAIALTTINGGCGASFRAPSAAY